MILLFSSWLDQALAWGLLEQSWAHMHLLNNNTHVSRQDVCMRYDSKGGALDPTHAPAVAEVMMSPLLPPST